MTEFAIYRQASNTAHKAWERESYRLGRADLAFLKISTQRPGSGFVEVDVKPHCSASACAVPLCARDIAGSVVRHSLSAKNVAKMRSKCATRPGSRFAASRSSGACVTARVRSCQRGRSVAVSMLRGVYM